MNGNVNQSQTTVDSIFYTLLAITVGCAILFFIWNGKTGSKRTPSKASKKQVELAAIQMKFVMVALLVVGGIIRLASSTIIEGYPTDIGCFKAWADAAAKNLLNFYNTDMFVDYPPFYIYILFLLGKTAHFLGILANSQGYVLLIKLPAIIADLLTAYFLYKISEQHLQMRQRLLVMALYLFSPAILLNSTVWGQVDSILSLMIVGALYYLMKQQIGYSAILFTCASLMKPQGLIFLPVPFFELLRRKKPGNFIVALTYMLVTALIIVVPFSLLKSPTWLFKLYFNTAAQYPYASLNAFNLHALLGGNFQKDSIKIFIFSYKTWGTVFMFLIVAYIAVLTIRNKGRETLYTASLILGSGVFILGHRMHERYLFPALVLALMVYILTNDKWMIAVYTVFSITVFINTRMVLFGALKKVYFIPQYDPVLLVTSLVNVIVFAYLIKRTYRDVFGQNTGPNTSLNTPTRTSTPTKMSALAKTPAKKRKK